MSKKQRKFDKATGTWTFVFDAGDGNPNEGGENTGTGSVPDAPTTSLPDTYDGWDGEFHSYTRANLAKVRRQVNRIGSGNDSKQEIINALLTNFSSAENTAVKEKRIRTDGVKMETILNALRGNTTGGGSEGDGKPGDIPGTEGSGSGEGEGAGEGEGEGGDGQGDGEGEEETDPLVEAVKKIAKEEVGKVKTNVEEVEKIAAKVAKKEIKEAMITGPTVVINKKTGKKKEIEGTTSKHFSRIVQLAEARKNVMLKGPAGCGKTTIASQVAEALELPFYSISCSAGMSESQLAGWLIPTGDNGKFEYHAAPFVKAYTEGGVFLLDELDAADPNLVVFTNTALANGEMHIPHKLDGSLIKKHKDFVCIAAVNTYGNGPDAMYVGRNQLDAASLDRFRIGMVEMDYDPVIETKLCNPEVLEWGLKIRAAINDKQLSRVMSTRFLAEASDMQTNFGWTLKTIKDTYFADWSKDEKRKVNA